MAEALTFSIAESLLSKLTSIALNEVGLIYNCHEDLGKLVNTLSIIKDVLLDAEELQEKSHFVRNRIKKLEEVLYDAEDFLDDVATQNLRRNLDARGRMTRQVCDFFSSSNHVTFRRYMGHAIIEIRERLDEIASDISKFNFISNRVIVNTGPVGNRERDTDSFLSDVIIIGREKEKNEMIEMLIGSGSNTTDSSVSPIIPIVGIGGLGKTTFAKLVFNDERVVKHFEPRIWVCVSEDFKKEVIVRNILRCIADSSDKVEDLNMENLQNLLRKKLDGKRYLLVLDDVWNEDRERWIQLKPLLMVEANGSKIMVTTRSKKVASAMGVDSPFLLKGLSDEQSLELFEKLAFKEGLEKVLYHKLKEIGKELVTRCEGVPLAIKTLGSTMWSKTSVGEWESIQKNKIWSLSSGNSGILSVLKLSYDQLPTHLKCCFSYCSIFPKDHKIQCVMLIQLWMAQGYVMSSEPSENLEKIGMDYVKDFLSLSFFQEVEVDDYKSITSFKMHDLIHDLAIEVGASNYYFIGENDAKNNNVERVHHVSLESGVGEIPERLLRENGTRTFFLAVGWSGSGELSHINVRQHRIMSNFKCLRVLDLHDCGIKKMRSSIGLLTHLRYLDLSENERLKRLPNSISNLLNLQTLKLTYCRDMEKLPMGITKLINLRYLMIGRLRRMPPGLNKLVLLQRLSNFVVGKDKNKNKCGRLSELKGLNNLGGELYIEYLERVQVDDAAATKLMKEKEHLQSLILAWRCIPESAAAHSATAELVLETLEPHPNLKELKIDGYCGVRFPSWMKKMSNVVSISLYECRRCQLLQPLDQLPCLKFLSLEELDSLEYIQEEEDYDDDNNKQVVRDGEPPSSSSSVRVLLFFPSLQRLELLRLPKLKGWWRKRESKSSSSSTKEEEEEEEEEEYASSFVFPQLTKLTIRDCPISKLNSLLESRRLKKKKKEIEGEGEGFRYLTSLRTLEIRGCAKLKSISREVQHLTALENLILINCPELELSNDDDGMHWQGLRSLRKLEISKIPKLVTLPVGIQHLFTTLQHLRIHRCSSFLAVPDWIGNLTQLQQLVFFSCRNLASLPLEIRCLTSLQQLEIDDCPNLTERCQKGTGEDWLKIARIPNIQIDGRMIQGTYFYYL